LTGAELKRIRLRLGLTQTELARELGVTRNSVTRWETGVHKVPPMTTYALRVLAGHRGKKAE
jgi:transcriptional regulator with XRE-family HTH domain